MLIIHIGVGKTATTTLQQNVFSNTELFSSITPYLNDGNSLLKLFSQTHDYQNSVNEIKDVIAGMDDSKCRVISHEELSDTPFIVAQKIRDIKEEVKVVLTIREQKNALMSQYKSGGYHLKPAPEPYAGRTILLDDYINYLLKNKDMRQWSRLSYYNIYKMFTEAGLDVKVLPYEYLKIDTTRFARLLSEICEVPIDEKNLSPKTAQNVTTNKSLEQIATIPRLISKMETVVKNPVVINEKIRKKKILNSKLSKEHSVVMDNVFRPQNCALSKVTNLDLGALGYCVKNN